jgi:NADPH:quinone reductase-like Zn-dependent oxidoreductase
MDTLHLRTLVGCIIVALAAFALSLASTTSTKAGQQDSAPSASMKAIRIHSNGGREVLKYEDAPMPQPADDELLVRVIAAGVNPVDYKIRNGGFRRVTEGQPLILGFDVAGVVHAVGPKVTKFKAGDAVFAYTALSRGGGYAEYAIAKESEAALKPRSLTFVEAAAVPLAALTAWQALLDTGRSGGGLKEGQTVLIHGGSGGVGAFAVQIAKAKGAEVIATASAANQDFLREMGADVAIDYTTQKFEDIAKDVDVVLDTVGGETQKRSFNIVKNGGTIVSIVGMPDQTLAKERGVTATGILVKPDAAELAQIAALIDAGQIKVTVSQVVPLADAAKAHEQIETGHTRGKIVLKVAEEPKG